MGQRLVLTVEVSDPRKAGGAQPEKWFLGLKVVLVEKGTLPRASFLPRGAAGAQPPPVDMNFDIGCFMSHYHRSSHVLRLPSSVTGTPKCLTVYADLKS